MAYALLPKDLHMDMGPLGELRLETALSEERRRVAREELRETEAVVPDALAELRRLMRDEQAKGLRAPLDDAFLMSLLRPCHWYPESAFERLRRYFAFKSTYPRVGRPMEAARADAIVSSGVLCILPHRDQHGRRILLLRTGRMWNHKKIPIDDVLAGVLLCLELSMAEPDTQVAGAVVLWDLQGLSLPQVFKFTPSFAKMLVTLLQDAVPLRSKAFHFVNQTQLFDIAFNVIKPLVGDKLRKRLFFHGKNWTSLAQHVDPKVLPVQYGGVHELHLDLEQQVTLFRTIDGYFAELAKYGYEKSSK